MPHVSDGLLNAAVQNVEKALLQKIAMMLNDIISCQEHKK